MPSPVGHTLFGLGIYVVWCRNIRLWFQQIPIIIWVIICANLPDFDLFAGLIKGDLRMYHQQYTHTLGFAVIIGILTYIILRVSKNKKALSISILSFIVVLSHIILDAFNRDSSPPIGVMLFWPFSNKFCYIAQIFYPVPHSYISDIFSSFFIRAVISELVLIGVPLGILILLKLKKSYGKG